ncbi:recombinase RecA [Nannocystaceae bacterium ST9]
MARKPNTKSISLSHDDDNKLESPVREAVRKTITAICERFGKGAIMALGGDPNDLPRYDAVPTGSLGLDEALGIGGLPLGRIVEIYGPESSGKTTLTLHLIAEAQRRGLVCAFIDAEHALDVVYARSLGVELDELLVSQPDHGEQALDIADSLARTSAVGVIVIDSVAALIPKAELEGDMGDHHVGLHARLMSQAMRKLSGIAAQTNTMMIFINQLRHKIGVTFGSPEVTTGGNALKYYASVRLDIRRIATLKDGEKPIGSRTRVKVVKNKCAPPFAQAEFEIGYGQGIDREAEVLDRALELGLIEKSGSWFSCGDTRIGQGRNAALIWLREHEAERDRLLAAVRASFGGRSLVVAEAVEELEADELAA